MGTATRSRGCSNCVASVITAIVLYSMISFLGKKRNSSRLKIPKVNTFKNYEAKVFCVSSLGITIGNDVLNGDSEASEICYAPCGKVYYAIDHWPLSFGLYRTNIDGTEWEDVTWIVY